MGFTKIVPWSSLEEWEKVASYLFADSSRSDLHLLGVKRVIKYSFLIFFLSVSHLLSDCTENLPL